MVGCQTADMVQFEDLVVGDHVDLDAQGRPVRLNRDSETVFNLTRNFDGSGHTVATLIRLDDLLSPQWRVTRGPTIAGPVFDKWEEALQYAINIAAT